MTIQSKITAQGQISVPAEVRRALGVGPGSVLEWEQHDGQYFVRRAHRYSIEEVRAVLFPEGAPTGPPVDVKKAIETYIRGKHARD